MDDDLYRTFAEALEVDEVRPDDVLSAFENWDSLTILSIIATIGSTHGVNLTAAEVRSATTAGSLVALVAAKKKR